MGIPLQPCSATENANRASPIFAPRATKKPLLLTAMNWWVLLVLVLPLLITGSIMNATELPRFALLAAFCLSFLLVAILRSPKRLQFQTRGLTLLLGAFSAAFLVVMIIAAFGAVNKQESLDYILRYALVFLTAVLFWFTAKTEGDLLPRLAKALTITALAQALVGIFQFYGLAFTELPPVGHLIPYGLHGNRNIFSSFMAFVLPFCGFVAYAGHGKWRWFGGGVLWLCIYALILGQSRSSWLAFAGSLGVSSTVVLWHSRRLGAGFIKGWFKSMAAIGLGTVVAVFLAFTIPNEHGLGGQLSERAKTLVQLSDENSLGSGAARIGYWKQSWKMLRDHPLLGVGPGNWRVAAPAYGAEELPEGFKQGKVLRDYAHNVYVQNATETGVPGLAIYLGLWLLVGLIALIVIPRIPNNSQRVLALCAFAAVVAFGIDSLFSFANAATAHCLVIAIAVAIIAALYDGIPGTGQPSAVPMRWEPRREYLLVPLLLMAFTLYFGDAKARFEYHNLRARSFLDQGRPDLVPPEINAGLTPLVTIAGTGEPLEFWAAEAYMTLGKFDLALENIAKAARLNPGYLFTAYKKGRIYARMGRPNDAIAAYRDSLRLAPKFQYAITATAFAFYSQKMFRECAETLQNSDYLEHPESVQLYANALRELGDNEKAAAVLREGLVRFPDSQTLRNK